MSRLWFVAVVAVWWAGTGSDGYAREGYRLGADAPIYTASSEALNLSTEVTLEAWVKADRMSESGGRILDKSNPGTQVGYMLDTHPGNSLRLLNAKGMCRFDAALPADAWTHVVGVYSVPKKIMRLYRNGQEVARLEGGDFPRLTASRAPLCIGTDPDGGNRFRGRILRAAVYGRVLTEQEILARAAAPDGKAPAGVLGDWVFTASPGETIKPVGGDVVLRRGAPRPSHSFAGTVKGAAEGPDVPLALWYREPASTWSEALPVGNGRLGAMVFGRLGTERIQFNEDTVWTGTPHSYARDGAVKVLPRLRALLQEGRGYERKGLAGRVEAERLAAAGQDEEARSVRSEADQAMRDWGARQKEAEELAMAEFMSDPLRQKAYQPCGDLWLEFPKSEEAVDYRRWLDLDAAVAVTEYRIGSVTHRRQVAASFPDNCLIVHLDTDRAGAVNCLVRLSSPHAESEISVDRGRQVRLRGEVQQDGVRFEAWVEVSIDGGSLQVEADGLRIVGADQATLRLAAATNVQDFRTLTADPGKACQEALDDSRGRSFGELLATHQRDHQALFRRVRLDLGTTDAARLPTPDRIEGFKGGDDPHLAALTFQYGRYLLIGSSRAGGQPANLQGLWNESVRPPWDSKYTVNINTEMNYWPALVTNLAECQEPLFDALEDLVVSGRETARVHYDAPGWVLHHNFDLWRGTAPINHSNHGIWPTGGAWLATHLWEHYLYTRDEGFLRTRAYPILREAALFFTEYLVEDPHTGWLISGPSNSPEQGGLVMGPTMDHQIVRDLFRACVQAADVLGTDGAFASRLEGFSSRIAPNQVGRHGQLQEWTEDKDNPNNRHRHVSHLWGIHPGADITWQQPDLFEAGRQSLLFRGDAATGWSMGWKINLWARFLDGDHAHIIVGNLLEPAGRGGKGGMYPNLFDAHPPFQIDGNFGYTAGIAEMLLQSHVVDEETSARVIHLLPALPGVWPAGSVQGLRARGGVTVDLAWQEGALTSARLTADHKGTYRILYGDRKVPADLEAGGALDLDGALQPRRP